MYGLLQRHVLDTSNSYCLIWGEIFALLVKIQNFYIKFASNMEVNILFNKNAKIFYFHGFFMCILISNLCVFIKNIAMNKLLDYILIENSILRMEPFLIEFGCVAKLFAIACNCYVIILLPIITNNDFFKHIREATNIKFDDVEKRHYC